MIIITMLISGAPKGQEINNYKKKEKKYIKLIIFRRNFVSLEMLFCSPEILFRLPRRSHIKNLVRVIEKLLSSPKCY